jgi:hypothetical protein
LTPSTNPPPPSAAPEAPRFFGRLALFVLGHRRLVTLVASLLTLLCVPLGLRLGIDSNMVRLLPRDDPAAMALSALEAQEGGVVTLTLTVGGGTPEARHAWLSEVATRLEALPEVDHTFHQVEPELARRLGLMQLSPADLTEVRDRLRGAVAMGPAIQNPMLAGRILALGPLTEKMRKTGFYARLNPGEDMSRLIVRPNGPAMDLPFSRKLMAEVHRVLDELPAEARGLELLWVGGAYRHAVEDFEGILNDIKFTATAAFLTVLLVIGVGLRSPRGILLVFAPMTLANLWTLGLAGATVGRLNTFTSFFNAVVIGLGVAYPVHLYSRYREERRLGAPVETAIARAWDRVGGACTAAAVTTIMAFVSLGLAHFRGFQQLGLLGGVGVALCLLAALLLLPLLILWLDRTPVGTPAPSTEPPPSQGGAYRHARWGLALALTLTAALAVFSPRIGFQYDISEVRRDGLAFSDLDKTRQSLARDSYAPIVVTYPDDASLRAGYAATLADIEAGRLPGVMMALSLYTMIPVDQEDRLRVLEEIAEIARNENARYLPPVIRQNLQFLVDEPVRPLSAEDLPAALRAILGASRGQHRMLLMGEGNMWDMRQSAALHDTVMARYPDLPVAGEFLCLGSLYKLLRADAPVVSLVAFVLIALVTFLDLGRRPGSLAAVGVLVAGCAWAAGMLGLLGVQLSMVNIVGIPIVLGTAVDIVIHLFHRVREEGPGGIRRALRTTGKAAILTNLTGTLGFAALILAGTHGVRSLGIVVSLGLLSVTCVTLVLVPLGFGAWWRGRRV